MLSEIFQKQYDFEHQRRIELTSSTSSPIVAITVLSSAAAVTLVDYPYATSNLSSIFIGLTTFTLIALFMAVYYIFRSIWNYIYNKLPPAPALDAHFKSLTSWHLAQGDNAEQASAKAQSDFSEYITERIAEAADWNGQNNDRRGNFLHMSTTSLAFALAFFVPTALTYAYAKAIAPDKVHRVELLNPPHQPKDQNVTNPSASNTNKPAATPAPAPSAPASTPTTSQSKPIGPSNTQFRTNAEIQSPQANATKK